MANEHWLTARSRCRGRGRGKGKDEGRRYKVLSANLPQNAFLTSTSTLTCLSASALVQASALASVTLPTTDDAILIIIIPIELTCTSPIVLLVTLLTQCQ